MFVVAGNPDLPELNPCSSAATRSLAWRKGQISDVAQEAPSWQAAR